MKLEMLPYVEINGARTIPDDVVRVVYQKMVDDGTLTTVFYDGSVKSDDDLLRVLKSPLNYVVFGLVDGSIKGLAWINELNENRATAHFCVFNEARGLARALGKKALEYWFTFPNKEGNPMFDLILGVTPASYVPVLKFITSIGFTVIGQVPKVLYDDYEKKRINAVLSYCERPA